MSDILIVNGVRYVTHSALSFSDYGGAGAHGVANVKYLQDNYDCAEGYMSDSQYDKALGAHVLDPYRDERKLDGTSAVIVLHGSYGGECAYIREEHEECEELLAALEDSFCFSDEDTYEVEMQWQDEAWNDWLQSDLYRALAKFDSGEALQEKADMMHDSVLHGLMHDAMEATNTYWETEYNSCHVRVDSIIEVYADLIEAYDFGPQCLCPSISDAQIELPL